jgi:hypothetical protein
MANVSIEGLLLSGRVGALVFCRRGRGTYARAWVRPADPKTPNQKIQRGRVGAAVQAWRELSDEDKDKYRRRAAPTRRHGYHLFVAEFLALKT